ncbi:unnamed protein product [Soboliphyme baturini]|uniref:P-type phospholipid transporter n=1 Tax=Soboliphyme baturini TaxID=241478 RepID=A0A183J9U4_9BILA|nr:unnamed protein product [Soboliphyme baturini]
MNPDTDRFWRLISLCHTVMSEMKNNKLEYMAQSPDEAALVGAARNFGYVFKSRTPDSIMIEVMGVEETYELKCILDFNNYRKRMSVLVKKDGKVTLYCKGADTMIFERISKSSAAELEAITQSHLDKFANDGLRTLCLAYKEVDVDYFEDWSRRYEQASILMKDRQETLNNLIAANIKIWVLTGDKQETAINIGYSCRLLTVDLKEVFVVDGKTLEDVRKQLEAIIVQLNEPSTSNARDGRVTSVHFQEPDKNSDLLVKKTTYGSCSTMLDGGDLQGYGLVINGQSLTFALEPQLSKLLFTVGCACRAVICCRVTPLQKALVVELVKNNRDAVTLAIGDGANDVSMIKTAHIGVGVSGQEGMQAVLASDFSIAQFRYLEKLLLVHGRWSYLRMAKFLQYFFYKNFAFTTVYDPLFIAFYNLFFTSLPVLGVGIFDQDVDEKYSLK